MLDNYSLLKRLEKNLEIKFITLKQESLWNLVRLFIPLLCILVWREGPTDFFKYLMLVVAFLSFSLTFSKTRQLLFSIIPSSLIEFFKFYWLSDNKSIAIKRVILFGENHNQSDRELNYLLNVLKKTEPESLDFFIFLAYDEFMSACHEMRHLCLTLDGLSSLEGNQLQEELKQNNKLEKPLKCYNEQFLSVQKIMKILSENENFITPNYRYDDFQDIFSRLTPL